MASENVFSLAEEMEWWDPKSGEPFKFWKAYSGRKPYSTREYFILSSFAPSLNLSMDMEELPFTVKPEKKVSIRDIHKMYRQTYEGTELDMTKDLMVEESISWRRRRTLPRDYKPKIVKSPVANPWMSRDVMSLLNTIKPGTVRRQRTIAIAGCSYSQIVQLRDWLPDEIGGRAFFSFDNPAQSPRIPIYAGTLDLPKSFNICGQYRFRTDAAIWAFRRANKLATIKWQVASEYIEQAVMEFEDKAFSELPDIEKKALELYNKKVEGKEHPKYREFLTHYTNSFAHATINKWTELGDIFWGLFGRGF
jgi:dipeptidase